MKNRAGYESITITIEHHWGSTHDIKRVSRDMDADDDTQKSDTIAALLIMLIDNEEILTEHFISTFLGNMSGDKVRELLNSETAKQILERKK